MSDYSKLNAGNMALAVVLYNPTKAQIHNLKELSNFKQIIVIDNSKKSNIKLVQKNVPSAKLNFHHYPENIGLSKAYNISVRLAKKDKIDFLMLADQDSKFEMKVILKMSDDAKKLKLNLDKFAILGFAWYENLNLAPKEAITDEQLIVFSSGSILNIKIIDKIGGFDERFYIDSVDSEISLRAISMGYRTGKMLNLGFQHSIGNSKQIHSRLFNKDLVLYNHSPIRSYYQIRNSLLIKDIFKEKSNPRINQFINDIENAWIKDKLRSIFYEKNKFKKFYYCFRGWLDFKLKRFGKINHKT